MNLQHTHKCCSLFTIQPKVQADVRTFSQAKSRPVSGNQDGKVLHKHIYSTNPEKWRSQLLLMSNGALHVHDTSSQSSGNTMKDFLKLGFALICCDLSLTEMFFLLSVHRVVLKVI